ncbi:MAG: helix-turn-helix domain-containing protein [Chloroflexota bacterium]
MSVLEKWLTAKEAAELSGYHPERIRELIREGKIDARKFGSVWAVKRESLITYMRQMQRQGERRGPKKSQS